uniref:Uncharacterized protein n=1 Tax=Arundo donax TaxID=35708 RepID=A0A0A9AVP7_ARUDO
MTKLFYTQKIAPKIPKWSLCSSNLSEALSLDM